MGSKGLSSREASVREKYAAASEYIRNTSSGLEERIIQQIDVMRTSERLTINEMCEFTGITYSSYMKIINSKRKLKLCDFLIICRLLGCDISKLVGESYLDSADSVFRELAIYFGQLQTETIEALAKVLAESSESDLMKKHGKTLFEALQNVKTKEDFEPLYLFASDVPKESK